MLNTLAIHALRHIEITKATAAILNIHANTRQATERSTIKSYAAASCITHVYAIYEKCIGDALSGYLDLLPACTRYSNLNSELQDEYRSGFSSVLANIRQQRYRHLSHSTVVQQYYEAIADNPNYRFIPEALIRHSENLRLSSLLSLFGRLRLSDLKSWLTKHDESVGLYHAGSNIYSQLESEIANFILLRNEAAHGAVLSIIPGPSDIDRICAVVSCVINVATQYLHHCSIELRTQLGTAKQLGTVQQVYRKANAIVAELNNGSSLSVGDTLCFLGDYYITTQEVGSLQINGLSHTSVLATTDKYVVGISCDSIPQKNTAVYLLI